MKRRIAAGFGIAAALAALCVAAASAQTVPSKTGDPASEMPAVFLDRPGADLDFFRGEIPFARFVASLEEAQVHVRITGPAAEVGGSYSLAFTGLREFSGDDYALTYEADSGAGPEDVRKGLARSLKIGLVRYAAKTPASKLLSVDFKEQVRPTAVVDKWDFWVFNLSANHFFNGQQQFKRRMYFGNFSANRVTPELKVRMSVYASLSDQEYYFGEEVITGSSESYGFSGLFVKSLGEHWSAGVYLSAASSSYQNLDLSVNAAPAVEYNVFPYSESTKKQLRFLYRIGYTGVRYREETVYFKTSEGLLGESLSATLEFKQPWGTSEISLEGSHYFHDFKKYRLVLGGDISFRIWKGLSFNVDGRYSLIRDQLSLPRGGASYEDVLLRQKQLATGYSYMFSVGLNFSFGSTRSSIVNPRFGSGGGISISF